MRSAHRSPRSIEVNAAFPSGAALALGLALACAAACTASPDASPPGEQRSLTESGPPVVEGNPTCADLGLGTFSMKVDPPISGVYSLVAGLPDTVTVTFSPDGTAVDWSSTLSIDAVIVKGGPAANIYLYDPEATSDAGLISPALVPSGNTPEISHVDFCFDYEVKVKKTAKTSFKRRFAWKIAKSAAASQLNLSQGQVYAMGYQVTVETTGYTDSDFAATGQITITNPAPVAATITGVTDDLPGATSLTVDCGAGVSFPYTLPSQGTLVCDYSAALPDGTDRTNTATVTTKGDVGGGSATAAVDFAAADVTTVDACVDVTDTLAGALGKVCVADGYTSASQTFKYTHDIGPAVCGDSTVDNTASFTTCDGGQTGSASATVAVHVECAKGCSLTPGYWKTHSSFGPAPYDDTWALLASGANTIFYLSGASYYTVLWTPPTGNAYYVLAHAFIAARLNGLNGADTSAITSELAAAHTLFQSYTPAAIGALRGNNPLRAQFIALAGKLDQYNNGIIGPGHCSE